MNISPLSWVQRPQSFRAQVRPQGAILPNVSRTIAADTVRFGNAKKVRSEQELMNILVALATPGVEAYLDKHFKLETAKLGQNAFESKFQNEIFKVLNQDDKEVPGAKFKDTLDEKQKAAFKTELFKFIPVIHEQLKTRESNEIKQLRNQLALKADAYYKVNSPNLDLDQDYRAIKQLLIRDNLFPSPLTQYKQKRIDTALTEALKVIKTLQVEAAQRLIDEHGKRELDEAYLAEILEIATPHITEAVDQKLGMGNFNKNEAIATAAQAVWRAQMPGTSVKLGKILTPEQKQAVKSKLEETAKQIHHELSTKEGSIRTTGLGILETISSKAFEDVSKRTSLDVIWSALRPEIYNQLRVTHHINVQELTQPAQKRLEIALIRSLCTMAQIRDPQTISKEFSRTEQIKKIPVRPDSEIQTAQAQIAIKEAQQALKTGKIEKATEENDGEERIKTTITQHILPPAYSVLALPQNDLDLLKRQKPKPNAPDELSRWNDLHDNLGHDFVQFIANRNNVTEVLLEAGKPPQIKSPDNPEWHSETNWLPLTLENIQAVHPSKLAAREELANVLTVFPEWLQTGIRKFPQAVLDKLKEIRLAYGRLPIFSTEDQPFNKISSTQKIKDEDLLAIKSNIESQGVKFNTNHRATLPEALSRFAIGYYQDKPNEYTISVGQPIAGCYGPLQSLIENTQDNILIVGMAGTGKTSLLRHTLTTLSQNKHVRLIDVDGEVSGGGRVPVNVGNTEVTHVEEPRERRFFGERVLYALRDAVTNRRAHIIARDEVSDYKEATELVEIAKKGARVVTTVHAKDFADLVHNTELSPLVGGRKMSTVGDAKALAEGTGKEQVSRLAPCIFKTIIVLNTDAEGRHVATVIQNPDQLIDKIYKSSTKLA